jgi:hypothetical protein
MTDTRTEKYDFYENPPNSKQELREWLTSWLQKFPETPPLVEVNGQNYVQECGFRRGFHTHCVLKNTITQEYVWWVAEQVNLKEFPTTRFSNYENLLESVIDDYYKGWKLTG